MGTLVPICHNEVFMYAALNEESQWLCSHSSTEQFFYIYIHCLRDGYQEP